MPTTSEACCTLMARPLYVMPLKLPGDNILMTDQSNVCTEITAGSHGTLNRCTGSIVTTQSINNNTIRFVI